MKKNKSRLIAIMSVIWFVLICSYSVWTVHSTRKSNLDVTIMNARSFFEQIELTRAWNASYGGIYVPVTKDTQSSEYLNDKMHDIVVNAQLTLTKINPDSMTRQISEFKPSKFGSRFHLTSLKPIRPLNKPSEMEKRALESFNEGKTEFYTLQKDKEKQSFFYMAPLIANDSCLKCHGKQGYKTGNVRGGISVVLPLPPDTRQTTMAALSVYLGLMGFLGIYIFSRTLKGAYGVIEAQETTDRLTGVSSKRLVYTTLLQEIRRRKRENAPLALVLCDIDLLRRYNETHGRPAGDNILVRVASCIKQSIKRSADFCARYGGVDFVVVLPNTNSNGAQLWAERLRQNIENLNDKESGGVTVSLGIAALGENSSEESAEKIAEELYWKADDALYQAKRNGRNCSVIAGE
ncbi:MAG: diguanylate cyclase [Deltaproteobacteria bacterium]|nr:diguanylate cyclase [Deltaproteobacteria bacterium]